MFSVKPASGQIFLGFDLWVCCWVFCKKSKNFNDKSNSVSVHSPCFGPFTFLMSLLGFLTVFHKLWQKCFFQRLFSFLLITMSDMLTLSVDWHIPQGLCGLSVLSVQWLNFSLVTVVYYWQFFHCTKAAYLLSQFGVHQLWAARYHTVSIGEALLNYCCVYPGKRRWFNT